MIDWDCSDQLVQVPDKTDKVPSLIGNVVVGSKIRDSGRVVGNPETDRLLVAGAISEHPVVTGRN